MFDRYLAMFVPANLIGATDNFIRLRIQGSAIGFFFREIGTHDYL